MLPTIGRIVHYTLSANDVAQIEKRRGPAGAGGNRVDVGEVYPAVVVRTFGGDAANLQVLLDGGDNLWATSRTEGEGHGRWFWPPRV